MPIKDNVIQVLENFCIYIFCQILLFYAYIIL